MKRCFNLLVLVLALGLAGPAAGQIGPGLRFFLDCGHQCDDDFIRTEIPVVDFVRDRMEADVHLLVTTESTGAGGRVFTLAFLGRGGYANLSDTLEVAVGATDTDDEERREVTKFIKLGLARFLVRAGLTRDVGITFGAPRPVEAASTVDDPWNYWVFSLSANTMMNGEETSKSNSYRLNASANRTTELWKIRLGVSGSRSLNRFSYGDSRVRIVNESGSISAMAVKSIGTNWAAGLDGSVGTSSFMNTDASYSVGPAVEYNIFPYSESTRRELRIQYGMRMDGYWYEEETVFNLTTERLLKHYLSVQLDLRQPWGSLGFSTRANHLVTNFDRSLLEAYNVSVFGSADIRLVRGLSLNLMANYSRIRDQLSLPLSEATDAEVLLRARRLPTGYDYFVTLGFSYRFGSIFNNVVNPRFGGGGGRGMRIIMH